MKLLFQFQRRSVPNFRHRLLNWGTTDIQIMHGLVSTIS